MSPTSESLCPTPLPPTLDSIRVVATDMDGTLTRNGLFSADLVHALEQLNQAGVDVIIVTGRSAGWVQAVMNYLPVWGAIAENGGVFITSSGDLHILPEITNTSHHRQRLRETFQHFQSYFPKLSESVDNPFRITDWTFSVEDLSSSHLDELSYQAQVHGWGFTYSTVQCHIMPAGQNKASAVTHLIERYFSPLENTSILTVGDSPNDESLFNTQLFPYSVGVANIQHYLDFLSHSPTYITQKSEIDGFCELVQAILTDSTL